MRFRTPLVLIACALVLAAQRAGAAPPATTATPAASAARAATNQTCVVGDTLTMRGDREPPFGPEMIADGHVHVTSAGLQLRGPHLDVYKTLHYGTIDGGVFGADGLTAIMARRLTFELPDRELYLDTGKIVIKERMTPAQLTAQLDSADPYAMFREGRNGLTMTAERIRRDDHGHFEGHNAWITTCVCPDGCKPMLSVDTVDAYIVPKERSWVVLPVYRFYNAPILALPVGSLPMKSRETGLLFPLFGNTASGSYYIMLPLFITLGDSADVTFSPLWNIAPGIGTPVPSTDAKTVGIQGPGADVLFRWRPALDAIGSLHLTYFYDTYGTISKEGKKEDRGSRGEAQLLHSQKLLGGHAGVSTDLVTDSGVIADTALTTAREEESYTRSWAEYSRTLGSFNLSFDSNYIQDLNPVPGGCLPNESACYPRTSFNQLPAVITPVAELTASTANRWGPAMFEEELNLAYEDSWGGQPFNAYQYYEVSQGSSQPFANTPHARHLLGGLSFAQTAPIARGRFGWISWESGERLQGTPSIGDNSSDGDGGPAEGALRGGGYVGFLATSRIARTFGNGWVHDIVPALQVRALDSWSQDSANFGFSPGLYPDRVGAGDFYRLGLLNSPLDMALPSQGTVQAVLSVTTDLTPPKGPPMTLRIEEHPTLYQRGDSPLDPGQLLATLTLPVGFNTVFLSGAYDLKLGEFTQWHAGYDRTLPFGTFKLGGGYLNGATGDQISRGLDTLFTPRFELPNPSLPVPPGELEQQYQAFAGVNFHFGQLSVLFSGGFTYYLAQSGNPASLAQSYGAIVSWSCEGCGKLSVSISWNNTYILAHGVVQQPLAVPIPSPNYQFGDMNELGRAAQLATFPTF